MTLAFDDIVKLDDAPEPAPPRVARKGVDWSPGRSTRQAFLSRSAVLGIGVGMATLGVLPPARKAYAACVAESWRDIYLTCPPGSSGFGCTPACGPSAVYVDACTADYWHKYTGSYRNRPNECTTGKDGWMWYRDCGCDFGGQRQFRCHDGCKLINQAWQNSICRWTDTGCIT